MPISHEAFQPANVAPPVSPPSTGVFRLTNLGMSEVSACKLKGFHPHSKEPPLFTVRPSPRSTSSSGYRVLCSAPTLNHL